MALIGGEWLGDSCSRGSGGMGRACGGNGEKQILNSTFLLCSSGFGKEVGGKEDAQPC